MSTNPRQEILNFALDLAAAAEREILPVYKNCVISFKPDGTEVTEADRRAERAMRDLIARRHPDHSILGEEEGLTESSHAGRQWILDPVDGTASFTLGIPVFGTLIGFLEDGKPVVGVIHFPALGETVYASKGFGCWFRGGAAPPTRIRVRPCAGLADAIVSSTSLHAADLDAPSRTVGYRLLEVLRRSRKFRFVSDCLQHALVCQGRIHAAVDTIMKPWDIAAIVPCVEEAGGIASTLSGNREGVVWGDSLVTSSGEPLHSELLALLSSRESEPRQ